MVYYGVVSRGCQRCRQRKVKCDLRKPQCLRCEKSKTECPGFRNLADVLFRDESERIIRKAHALVERTKSSIIQDEVTKDAPISSSSVHSGFSTLQSYAIAHRSESAFFDFLPPTSISYGISQPANDLGAHFFFANYTCDDPPLSVAYCSWLTKTYLEESPNHALRTAIEATGMAGISNRFYAPDMAAKSKVQYGRALAATKQALYNPVKSIEDSTLAAVILLGFFEFINCGSWDQYHSWVAHIKGATTLLHLRGQKQFTYERGGQLYKQLFSQLLYAFVLLDVVIHPSADQFYPELRLSAIERHGKNRSGVLGDICFRLLWLRLRIKSGEITDQQAIRETATKLDNDLEAWRANRGPGWLYTTVDASSPVPKDTLYHGKRHLYSQLWTAYLWNNWRTLRILINRIIVQNEMISKAPDHHQKAASLSLIHGMSTEICVSVASFFGSPRTSTLIWPLFIVSEETLNPLSQRIWAMNQLRAIGSSMGIRLAGLLAATISQSLHVAPPS